MASSRHYTQIVFISAFSSPLQSPAHEPALSGVERTGLYELAQTGHFPVLHVPCCQGLGELTADQEPDVAATEDHQQLLGHHLKQA